MGLKVPHQHGMACCHCKSYNVTYWQKPVKEFWFIGQKVLGKNNPVFHHKPMNPGPHAPYTDDCQLLMAHVRSPINVMPVPDQILPHLKDPTGLQLG